MVDIPEEIQIRSTIHPGAVYYFEEELLKTNDPHYFIVLNQNPLSDKLLLLVVSSSNIEKVKWRNKNNPLETIVEISPKKYSDFTKNSIIDCNSVFLHTIDELVEKLKSRNLRIKSVMPNSIVIKLRKGVVASPMVEDSKKRIIE